MVSAIIVAAGKGTRMGPKMDKLFLELDGCPIVAHTWRRFDEAGCVDEIVLVVRDGIQAAFKEIAERHHFRKRFVLVVGGKDLPGRKSGGEADESEAGDGIHADYHAAGGPGLAAVLRFTGCVSGIRPSGWFALFIKKFLGNFRPRFLMI